MCWRASVRLLVVALCLLNAGCAQLLYSLAPKLPAYGPSRGPNKEPPLPEVPPGTIPDNRYWGIHTLDYSKTSDHVLMTICPIRPGVGCTLVRMIPPAVISTRFSPKWQLLPGLKSPLEVSYHDAIYLPEDKGIVAAEIGVCDMPQCQHELASRLVLLDVEGRHQRYLTGWGNRRLPSYDNEKGLLYFGTDARPEINPGREKGRWELYALSLEVGATEERLTDFNTFVPFTPAVYRPDGTILLSGYARPKDARVPDFSALLHPDHVPLMSGAASGAYVISVDRKSVRYANIRKNYQSGFDREYLISQGRKGPAVLEQQTDGAVSEIKIAGVMANIRNISVSRARDRYAIAAYDGWAQVGLLPNRARLPIYFHEARPVFVPYAGGLERSFALASDITLSSSKNK
ncbi:MAG: hypothetical protein R3E87_21745 [Burkholderiaceae bacterium]